ncbi:MAG: nitroreductase family protein [Deltaproteobacteria bacterium]|nr:nitroreductase family protein [Deltaproteobacteria bacterium]
MDFCEVNEKRRTIRRFQAPAREEQLIKIIKEGTKAPSSRNTQGWEFVGEHPGLVCVAYLHVGRLQQSSDLRILFPDINHVISPQPGTKLQPGLGGTGQYDGLCAQRLCNCYAQ